MTTHAHSRPFGTSSTRRGSGRGVGSGRARVPCTCTALAVTGAGPHFSDHSAGWPAPRPTLTRQHGLLPGTRIAGRLSAQRVRRARPTRPGRPTLCEGWTTRDLTAHLVIRESRPDASAGIVLPPLTRWTDKVQASAGAGHSGCWWSKCAPDLRDSGGFNAAQSGRPGEHDGVFRPSRRRPPSTAGLATRDLDVEVRQELFKRLLGNRKMLYRTSPVPVLEPTDVPDAEPRATPSGAVVLRGPIAELVMHAYGREAVRDVEVLGDPDAVEAYQTVKAGNVGKPHRFDHLVGPTTSTSTSVGSPAPL